MFISAERVLEVSIGTAQVRLANLVHRNSFGEASAAAYQGGVDDLLRVGPLGDPPGMSRLVRIQFVDPVYRDNAMTMGLRWEAVGVTGGLFPVLDADIRLSAEDAERTRVALIGSYRSPLGGLGAGLDRVLLHKVAAATINALLAYVADTLSGGAAEGSGMPARLWWQPEPELIG
jgi:hypothetical protein